MAVALVGFRDGIVTVDRDGVTAPELEGRSIARLVRGRDAWWAVGDGTVYRRDDQRWHVIADAVEDSWLQCALPLPDAVLAGTADGRLLRIANGDVERVESFDAVDGREGWHAVGSSVPYVRSMSATADDGAVLANVHVGGIPRSVDGGASWTPTIDPEADVHEVRAHPTDPSIVCAAAAVGICRSTDGGLTWDVSDDGLHATYARAVAFTDDALLVSVSEGPFTKRGTVYRAPVAGGPAERCRDGLPEWLSGNIDTGALDADGATAALNDNGDLYLSDDGGRSWSHIGTVPGAHTVGVLSGSV